MTDSTKTPYTPTAAEYDALCEIGRCTGCCFKTSLLEGARAEWTEAVAMCSVNGWATVEQWTSEDGNRYFSCELNAAGQAALCRGQRQYRSGAYGYFGTGEAALSGDVSH